MSSVEIVSFGPTFSGIPDVVVTRGLPQKQKLGHFAGILLRLRDHTSLSKFSNGNSEEDRRGATNVISEDIGHTFFRAV